MNVAEKLAATYLRLNGFLLLPHFTTLDNANSRHNHIDLIGIRLPHSREIVEGKVLPIDDDFFNAISDLRSWPNPNQALIGIAAEARTNEDKDFPTESDIKYVSGFLGGLPVLRLAFYHGEHAIESHHAAIHIGLCYAGLWIQERINWMQDQKFTLSKSGSWNWSESFLSDYLAMHRLGLLTDRCN